MDPSAAAARGINGEFPRGLERRNTAAVPEPTEPVVVPEADGTVVSVGGEELVGRLEIGAEDPDADTVAEAEAPDAETYPEDEGVDPPPVAVA